MLKKIPSYLFRGRSGRTGSEEDKREAQREAEPFSLRRTKICAGEQKMSGNQGLHDLLLITPFGIVIFPVGFFAPEKAMFRC